MWVRGLKHRNKPALVEGSASHPMWVRGLKHVVARNQSKHFQSHPMWVRGLKRSILVPYTTSLCVAPHVGAWIETQSPQELEEERRVAPHVGAWIETQEFT